MNEHELLNRVVGRIAEAIIRLGDAITRVGVRLAWWAYRRGDGAGL